MAVKKNGGAQAAALILSCSLWYKEIRFKEKRIRYAEGIMHLDHKENSKEIKCQNKILQQNMKILKKRQFYQIIDRIIESQIFFSKCYISVNKQSLNVRENISETTAQNLASLYQSMSSQSRRNFMPVSLWEGTSK
nr:15710_t:CDS:2 [Entrophospora candida]